MMLTRPARATACAMPRPICPAPSTPTVRISMRRELRQPRSRRQSERAPPTPDPPAAVFGLRRSLDMASIEHGPADASTAGRGDAARWLTSAPVAAGAYALVTCLVTLVGWATNLPRLTDWKNDGISMFPNTASC